MFTSVVLKDGFKKRQLLPFVLPSRRSPNKKIKPSPDYAIMKKITWPMLPKLKPDDRTTINNRLRAKFESEHLFGLDYVLGKKLVDIIDKNASTGFILVIGFYQMPFDNMDYAFMDQFSQLARDVEKVGATFTHQYPKHVRDVIFATHEITTLKGLAKICFKNTDLLYCDDLKKLKLVLNTLKKHSTSFLLLGGMVQKQLMSIEQLNEASKMDLDIDKLRGEMLGILSHHQTQTLGLLQHHQNQTLGLLQQHQQQFIGLLNQLEENKKNQ